MPTLPRRPAQVQPNVTYVDRSEVSETFADSVRLSVDGLTARLEFVVVRMDDPNPPAPPTGRAVTSARVVMLIPGLLDLHGKLTQAIAVLQAQGTLTPVSQPQQPPPPPMRVN